MWLDQKIYQLRQNGVLFPVTCLLIVISTDRYTKFLAEKFLAATDEISIFNSFLKFTFIQNYGGFLGIVSHLPENSRFFLLTICVSGLLLACLLYLFRSKKRTYRYDLPLAFVTGGGAGNLLDRLLHNGGVTDFLSVGVGNYRTGIFNLADVAILVGSFILGYTFFSSSSVQKQPPTTNP